MLTEEMMRAHILRNWGRPRLVRFAKHLLGDVCQRCPAHDLIIQDGPVRNPGPSGAFLGLLIAVLVWVASWITWMWLRT